MAEVSFEVVETQLSRILASADFVNGPRLGQFLKYVVAQKQAGHAATIKQYNIAVEGLGHSDSFDPITNPTIRTLARRLRRALNQYYGDKGSADPVRISIPKGSYVPIFAYHQTAREIANAPPRGSNVPSIAVFTFENLSDQENGALIANGLTGELLVALTRFSGLTVLGPLAHEMGQQIDFASVRRDYGAQFALKGWIRSDGSRIRITAGLIDTATGQSQWGQTFDYDLNETSLFEIEDEFTGQVCGVVADDLGVVFRRLQSESYRSHIKLSDVTTAVLAYNHAWANQTPQDWATATRLVNQALAKYPDHALLTALLSNIYYGEVLYGLNLVADAIAKMEELANKAVSLDPDLQIAQYNLVVQNAFFGRISQCIDTARKVVEMNPNHARILAGCAVAVMTVGDYDFGQDLIGRAKRLNPHHPGWYSFVDYLKNYRGEQFDDAWADAQRIHLEGLIWHPLLRAAILGKLGRSGAARPFVEELLQIKPDFREQPLEYIRPLFVTDEHVDMIWDGLQKAGILNA